MGLNNFIKAFLPKDKVFFSLFEEIGNNLEAMSMDFQIAMEEQEFNLRNQKLVALKEWEHKNDNVTHKVFVELGQNFITPFDREDIHYLATALDDIADYIYACAKKIIIYNLYEPDNFMRQLAQVVHKSTTVLAKAVYELRDMKHLRKITEACVQINSYENEADDLFDEAIKRLFRDNIDAKEIVKLKDIYEDLEIITDKCEDAADVIESIIVKYA